ncbi:MAG: hypothetical protein ACXAC7_02335 [Candidatus Hodarchaeales archaeon]
MAWKSDEEYQRRMVETQIVSFREESLRQVRTNISQILDALLEIEPKIKGKSIDNDFFTEFSEWFWKRNQKAKSAGTEKTLAYMNRIRRYIRIAIQMKTSSDKIHQDFSDLVSFFQELLRMFQDPEEAANEEDLSYLERIEILETILFPKIGIEPGKGPDDCLIHLSQFIELVSCLRVLLTPTIPPTIPKKIERKLFGLSEKISNIFAGITLNFVTDAKFFDVTANTPSGEEQWQIPGISYRNVMEPFLSDFGVNEKDFFKALCGHIGLQIAESKKEDGMYFILDPSFIDVYYRIGYLLKKDQEDGKTLWHPQISEDTLYLQYLALVATNRSAVQSDFAFWISLTFAYYLYRLISEEFIKPQNIFRGVVTDDLVRVSIVPYSVKAIALHLGGLEWSRKMPVEIETRKDVLSGLLKISNCNFTRLKAVFDERSDLLFEEYEEEEVEVEKLLSDKRYWDR